MNLKEKLNYYRLNEEEYERIQTLLGRTPQGCGVGLIFSFVE